MRQQMRQRANVVLMTMGEENAAHFFLVFLKIGEIRDYQIDARHILTGKHYSSINDEDFTITLDDS